MNTRFATQLIVLTAALAACSGSARSESTTHDATATGAVATAQGSTAPEVTPIASGSSSSGALEQRYACGQIPFDPVVLDEPGSAETAEGPVADALRAHLDSEEEGPIALPKSGWITVGESAVLVELIAPEQGADGAYGFVTVENRDGSWQVSGWGGCRPLAVMEGLSLATWNYAPDEMEPGPATTNFDAVVTERACTGGQEMGGRLLPPLITYGETEVTIIFAARPLPGGHDCPGNPASRVTVELREPLGDRVLRDAAFFPPSDPAVVRD